GEEARAFLDRLEEGYTLRFSRSGLVFDFDKPGTDPAEHEVGIEFHRVGSDLIRSLVQRATRTKEQPSTTEDGDIGVDGSEGQERVFEEVAPPSRIPRLGRAAFLVDDRDRSTTDLSTRSGVPSGTKAPEPGNVPPASGPTAVPSVDDSTTSELEEPTSSGDSSTATDEIQEAVGQAGGREDGGASASSAVKESVGATPPARSDPTEGDSVPEYDSILGVTDASPQFGLLGEISGRKVALDLNQTHTISLFGVQGGGKSYTLGSVVEMACMPIPGINALPYPLAGVIFHYSSTLDYQPEFTSMALPNAGDAELEELRTRYGAAPRALGDVVILTPTAKVEERRAEYPGIEVMPIAFAATELNASHWKFLMGAVGSQSMYIRQLTLIMKKLRGDLTLKALRRAVQESSLTDSLKELAGLRLEFAEEYIDDAFRLTEILRPGRLVIVDLRDEFIDKDEALGLFVVLLQMFADTTYQGRRFNKLVVFDEAHKYIGSPDLVAGLIEVVREMRHKGTSIMVASQDPPSVPTSLIELSTQIILHKFNSPAWLKHIQKANAALESLTPRRLASLGPGDAYVWSSKATDDAVTRGAVRVRFRPRVTLHGGGTKTAVRGTMING
ncbi:MAG: ATP-binding protein, partial [Chloroflexota bacterium]|nr:ATP-binding protein [Chloroflexota bacterium]